MANTVETYYRSVLGVIPPPGLDEAYAEAGHYAAPLLYRPGLDHRSPPSIDWALQQAAESSWPLEPGYVPLMGVDEQSIACVVADADSPIFGAIVRWHLTTDRSERQRDLLDTSAGEYIVSVEEELAAREAGLGRMLDEIGPAYEAAYLDNEKRPRSFVVRPVR